MCILVQADSHVPFTEEWLPSGHSSIKAWLVECCRDGCSSGRFSHLHRGSWSSVRVTIGFLVTSLTKALLPLLLSLARRPALGSPGGSKPLPFKNDGTYCVLGDLQYWRNVLVSLPQTCASTQSCLGALRTIPSTSWLALYSAIHCQLWDLKLKGVCAFPNHVKSI